jgi:hypothetical protein
LKIASAVFSFALKEADCMAMRKLKKYKPTRFMAKTSTYSKEMADYAVMFIESLTHTKGTWAGKPFELIDWQEQIIRDLFGVLKPNGYRQFNTAYIEIPKKMGKSELAAAVALLLCCGDGEERAEVYGCAADRQQATIVFDVAADMVRMCPALNRRVKILASQKRIIYEPTNSFYQVLSAEAYSKHGFNIHGVVFDELHTQPNRKLFDVMTKGSGDARMQPLYFLITTAGNDTNSICYEVHQKAQDILDGRKLDPTFYPVIYGAEATEDWTDPKVWKKANPSLAASAASVIAMAGTKVCMSPVAMLMIHNPATIAIGDTEEMQKAIDMLSEVKESIMNAYEIKSGLSRAKISKLMDAETWMNAKEARKLGFADEVLFAGGENPLPEEDDTIEMLFSRKAVTDSLLSRLIPKKKPEADKHMVPVIDLEKRLSLLAH